MINKNRTKTFTLTVAGAGTNNRARERSFFRELKHKWQNKSFIQNNIKKTNSVSLAVHSSCKGMETATKPD